MDGLIYRKTAKEIFLHAPMTEDEKIMIFRRLNAVPAADAVEVVHGYWYGTEYDGYADGSPVYDVFACSVCGAEIDAEDGGIDFLYCPYCGAKMDGKEVD